MYQKKLVSQHSTDLIKHNQNSKQLNKNEEKKLIEKCLQTLKKKLFIIVKKN